MGKIHIIFNFLFISNEGERANLSVEEKAPQEKHFELLKYVASANLVMSVEAVNNA